jgi:DNA anti-recombination protein RmuC
MLLSSFRTPLTALAAAALLLLATGCDDAEARSSAAKANDELNSLKKRFDEQEARAKKIEAGLQDLQARLSAQLNERLDKLDADLNTKTKDFVEKLNTESQATRDTANKIVGSARDDFDKQLQNMKSTLAGDIQKMREDTKGEIGTLKKFMDNQLRELYPYAYQPHREAKSPPEPDVKPQ